MWLVNIFFRAQPSTYLPTPVTFFIFILTNKQKHHEQR